MESCYPERKIIHTEYEKYLARCKGPTGKALVLLKFTDAYEAHGNLAMEKSITKVRSGSDTISKNVNRG